MGKLRKLRKGCNHKRNINGIYNEQLHYNCLQQLSTLRLTLLRGSYDIREFGWKKTKYSSCSLVPSLPAKFEFYSYLVENSQKATLNFYFKSRFSVKPSKFSTYFAHACSPMMACFPWFSSAFSNTFLSLREKCPYSELFWFAFPRIRTEYGKIGSISPYSVRMWENADQNTDTFYAVFQTSLKCNHNMQ